MSFSDNLSLWGEMWAPKPTWTVDQIPDLSGKVIIITGGNSGIGKGTARELLKKNARVYIACRSPEKAKAAAEDLKKDTGKTDNDLRVLRLDLADLKSVKSAVDDFLRQESRLDVLYNSAGVMWAPKDQFTPDGIDMQFGTNVLGHFYLTQLLLPTLLASVATSPDKHVRVVTLSSNGHWMAATEKQGGPIRYELLRNEGEGVKAREKVNTVFLYGQSKAGDLIFSHALARKYGSQGIVAITMNPGTIDTDLARHGSRFVQWLVSLMTHPISLGVLTPLYAGTAPEALELNGKYMYPWARVRPSRKDMDKEEHQEKLWSWCEEQVKLYAA